MSVGRDFYVEQAMLEAERIDLERMKKIIEALDEILEKPTKKKKSLIVVTAYFQIFQFLLVFHR